MSSPRPATRLLPLRAVASSVIVAVTGAPWAALADLGEEAATSKDEPPRSTTSTDSDVPFGAFSEAAPVPERPSAYEAEPDEAEPEIEIVRAPPRPRSRREREEEELRRLDDEPAVPPPPPPAWRLRLGAGVAIPLNAAAVPYLRLHQDVEWMPDDVAPFFFGLGGAEYVSAEVLGSVAARAGGATVFCDGGGVRCQGAVALTVGAFFGSGFVTFDVGGEGDVRFLFGGLELSIRAGFGGSGAYNFLFASGGVGAAF